MEKKNKTAAVDKIWDAEVKLARETYLAQRKVINEKWDRIKKNKDRKTTGR